MHREADLKSKWKQEMKRRLPGFYLFQIATAGWPDRGIVGAGHTSFMEAKHGTPSFKSSGLQELTACRLAYTTRCFYVIWQESASGIGKRTLIVLPKHVADKTLKAEAWCVGYNHVWLCNRIAEYHGL